MPRLRQIKQQQQQQQQQYESTVKSKAMVAVTVSDRFVLATSNPSLASAAASQHTSSSWLGGMFRGRADDSSCYLLENSARAEEKFETQVNEIRVNEDDVDQLLQDPEQFSKLKEILRERQSITDGTVKYLYHQLLRERINEMKKPKTMNVKEASQKLLVSWKPRDMQSDDLFKRKPLNVKETSEKLLVSWKPRDPEDERLVGLKSRPFNMEDASQRLLVSWKPRDFERERMVSPTSVIGIVCLDDDLERMPDVRRV